MPQTKPKSPTTPDIQTIDRISFDLGNRFNAITDGTTTLQYPSYWGIMHPRSALDLDFHRKDYKDGQSYKVQIETTTYQVGHTIKSTGNPTYGGNKWEQAKIFLYASLAGLKVNTTTHIKELRCSIPDDLDPIQRSPFEALANTSHQFKVNDQEYTIRIDRVRIIAEGKTAWLKATRDGLYKYPHMVNAVLDLGGGTAIARLLDGDAQLLRDRELVMEYGTRYLAQSIASQIGAHGAEDLIMDAIANQSFELPQGSFKAVFDALLPTWVQKIRSQMNTSWSDIQNRYAQILVVGGSAPLFTNYANQNPRYIIAPNPQTFALEGLQNA